MPWDLGLLGPLDVRYGSKVVRVGAARQRTLLASLLTDANRTVSFDQLYRRIWATELPAEVRTTLQMSVSRLRRVLASAGVPSLIITRPHGYLIEVDEDALDVFRFRRMVADASALLQDDPERAAQMLGQALAMWRGEALADVDSEVLQRETVPVLTEERLRAIEMHVDLRLRMGWSRHLIPELSDLTIRYPLQERFWAQRMLALYRSGRSSEALECYRTLRAHLADEVGTDPASALSELHHAILVRDPALMLPRAAGVAGHAPCHRWDGSPASLLPTCALGQPDGRSRDYVQGAPLTTEPRQLPAGMTGFVGRAAELKLMSELASRAADRAGMVILAIGGMAGAGKTALAVYLAHQLAKHFPDGQLYANMRGAGGGGGPADPGEVIRTFLPALGGHPESIPADLNAQLGLYRSLLAGQRVLILLDNAYDAAQVRPLLPGSPGCVVLVTSRSRLSPLAASDGAHLISLDVLGADEATELLSVRLAARSTAETEDVAEIAALCGQLPLALAIVAARMACRPELPPAAFAAELRDDSRRLDALDAGDPDSNLRTVLSWSFRGLSAHAADLFLLLGSRKELDISAYAAAGLSGMTNTDIDAAMRELADRYLVAERGHGRYSLHPLLRTYAAELSAIRC